MTFYLDLGLLEADTREVIRGATGALRWIQQEARVGFITPPVHPALHVQASYASLPPTCVELVPHLPFYDPLLQHIALVLQVEVDANAATGCLQAESLANALAIRFLRGYAVCRPSVRVFPSGPTPHKLQCTIESIQQYLDHELSLTDLAAAAQTSAAHFTHLFKQATGRTPHQYLFSCRIMCAK